MLIKVFTIKINISKLSKCLIRRNMYMYNEFINYVTKYIDSEEIQVVFYITFSAIISITIALQIEKYYDFLFQE